jgi:hypothetical protein
MTFTAAGTEVARVSDTTARLGTAVDGAPAPGNDAAGVPGNCPAGARKADVPADPAGAVSFVGADTAVAVAAARAALVADPAMFGRLLALEEAGDSAIRIDDACTAALTAAA